MTFREKLKQEHPKKVSEHFAGGCLGCPHGHGYEGYEPDLCSKMGQNCTACWDREIPGTEPAKKVGSIEIGVEVKNCKDCPGAGALRSCEVDGQRCYFHRFIEQELGWLQFNDEIVLGGKTVDMIIEDFHERGIIANCCSMEKLRHAYALVEFPDGTVKKVEPEKVRFLDREV